MNVGTVSTDLEAVTEVTVRGPGGEEKRVEAVVDTGYGGTLTLPARLIATSGFPSTVRVG